MSFQIYKGRSGERHGKGKDSSYKEGENQVFLPETEGKPGRRTLGSDTAWQHPDGVQDAD